MRKDYQARMIPAWRILSSRPVGRAEKIYSYNDLGSLHILVLFEDADGSVLAEDSILGDEDFLDLLLRRGIIHHVQHHVFEDGAQSSSAGFLEKRFPCDRSKRAFRELELHPLK